MAETNLIQSQEHQPQLTKLAIQLNLSFLLFSVVLVVYMRFNQLFTESLKKITIFSRLPSEEVADRMTVFLLLFLIGSGFFFIPKIARLIKSDRSIQILSTLTLLVMVSTISWRWGDPTFDQYNEVLWYGWGDKFAILILVSALLLTFLLSTNLQNSYRLHLDNFLIATNFGAIVLLVVYYLPSVIQPFKGIIDTYHSRYVFNDLLIFSTGKMPFTEITPQYIGVLGWPLRLFSFLPSDFVVNLAVVWVSALVVFEIFLIALLSKRALGTRYWAIAAVLPVLVMFVKVQPNMRAWGSLAQHLNLIPGRTVMPILLLFILSSFTTSKVERHKDSFAIGLGFVSILTGFNNVEFGIPAAIASLIIVLCMIFSSKLNKRCLNFYFTGIVSGFLFVFGLYQINDSSLTLSSWLVMIRAHGVDGFMNLAMPYFGLWIFFYAVLGSSAVLGLSKIARDFKDSEISGEETRSTILLSFGGLWGSATLFYFSGRSLVPEIVVFLIPLTLCIIGFWGLSKIYLKALRDTSSSYSRGFNVLFVPLAILLLIPIISLSQAPNPGVEWLRMAGSGERWSSRALKQQPKYEEMLQIVESNPQNSYVYMGNDGPAIELMSGVENGLGIILLQDLLISEDLTAVGCAPSLKSGADLALIPKADWVNPPNRTPCPGFKLLPIDANSEFLIYEIPGKVSP